MPDDSLQVSQDSKPAEPTPAPPHVRVYRFAIARMREPVTWVGLGFLWNCIQDNIDHLMTAHSAVQIGAAACAVIMRSPGSPWEAKSFLDRK